MHPKLVELTQLERNWDGEGAEFIRFSAIARAQATLDASDFVPDHIAPMSNGGLQFEYYGPHFDMEIEFTPDGEIALLVCDKKCDEAVEIHIPGGK